MRKKATRASSAATRKWRPNRFNPKYTDFVIRVLIPDADLIQDAAEAEALRLATPVSRNSFCAKAIIAAAKKELSRAVSLP